MDKIISPKITILMPVFNSEKYIEQAITSILNQSFKDFEFLIINDGSTDSSEIIIKSFNDERIEYLYNNENKGLVYSLNKGINLAKGELIARMDADDWAYPYRLERQIKFMLNNPEIGICGSSVELWDGINVNGTWVYPMYDEEIKAKLFFKCSLAHPTVMYRKNIFSNHNLSYSEEFFPAEDYELWIKMSKTTSFHNFNEPLLKYRMSGEQISNIKNKEQEDKTFEISWNQVLRLGFEDSNEYQLLHKSYLYGPWPNNLDQLQKLERWLELIAESNSKLCVYNQKHFLTELAKRFWNICYFLTKKNNDGIKIYKKSVLSKYYLPSLINRLKGQLKKRIY